jgi:hypothetical protein
MDVQSERNRIACGKKGGQLVWVGGLLGDVCDLEIGEVERRASQSCRGQVKLRRMSAGLLLVHH